MTQTGPSGHPPAENPWVAPPPGYASGSYPQPLAPTPRPVGGLGIATQVMVAVVFVANIALLFPTLHERSLFQRLRNDPTSVSLTEANDADRTLGALSLASTVLYIAAGIVWIVWFYRVRDNVDSWRPEFQRRAQGWAIGAWICPVVNLWFPAMMARDILDDSTRTPDHNGRRPRPLVTVWGIGFALMVITGIAVRTSGSSADSKIDRVSSVADFRAAMDAYTTATGIVVANIVVTLLTAIPAVLLVRAITSAQTRRMQAGTPSY